MRILQTDKTMKYHTSKTDKPKNINASKVGIKKAYMKNLPLLLLDQKTSSLRLSSFHQILQHVAKSYTSSD